eukprot:762509-Hanusia_phi.AAC.8
MRINQGERETGGQQGEGAGGKGAGEAWGSSPLHSSSRSSVLLTSSSSFSSSLSPFHNVHTRLLSLPVRLAVRMLGRACLGGAAATAISTEAEVTWSRTDSEVKGGGRREREKMKERDKHRMRRKDKKEGGGRREEGGGEGGSLTSRGTSMPSHAPLAAPHPKLEGALRRRAGSHGALDVLAEVTVLAVSPCLVLGELRQVVTRTRERRGRRVRGGGSRWGEGRGKKSREED